MTPSPLINQLLRAEEKSIARIIAFASYNPAIGRVLEGGGIKKFDPLACRLVRSLTGIETGADFDRLHARCVRKIMSTFRTSRRKRLSYGQAAKPINVFLKFYVDWAGRPNAKVRRRVLPFLHVPLDSVLMDVIRDEDEPWWRASVHPYVKGEAYPHSLALVDEELYWEWQRYFRERWPKKPLLFDIAWAVHRYDAS